MTNNFLVLSFFLYASWTCSSLSPLHFGSGVEVDEDDDGEEEDPEDGEGDGEGALLVLHELLLALLLLPRRLLHLPLQLAHDAAGRPAAVGFRQLLKDI